MRHLDRGGGVPGFGNQQDLPVDVGVDSAFRFGVPGHRPFAQPVRTVDKVASEQRAFGHQFLGLVGPFLFGSHRHVIQHIDNDVGVVDIGFVFPVCFAAVVFVGDGQQRGAVGSVDGSIQRGHQLLPPVALGIERSDQRGDSQALGQGPLRVSGLHR